MRSRKRRGLRRSRLSRQLVARVVQPFRSTRSRNQDTEPICSIKGGSASLFRCAPVKIFGIVNITADSFSDGGRYLAAEAAIAHARKLAGHGADVVDLGAASSNPDSKPV